MKLGALLLHIKDREVQDFTSIPLKKPHPVIKSSAKPCLHNNYVVDVLGTDSQGVG